MVVPKMRMLFRSKICGECQTEAMVGSRFLTSGLHHFLQRRIHGRRFIIKQPRPELIVYIIEQFLFQGRLHDKCNIVTIHENNKKTACFRKTYRQNKIMKNIQRNAASSNVEPLVGFEPTTPRLQITCSGQLS